MQLIPEIIRLTWEDRGLPPKARAESVRYQYYYNTFQCPTSDKKTRELLPLKRSLPPGDKHCATSAIRARLSVPLYSAAYDTTV